MPLTQAVTASTRAARLLDLLVGEALVAELGFFLRVDGGEEVFRGLGGAQLLHEVLVHEHLHHTGQHIHVEAAVLGGCDGKQQVGLAVVLGIVLHRVLRRRAARLGRVTQSHLAWGTVMPLST